MMTIGSVTRSVEPSTEVSQRPRNGLRHRASRMTPRGGWSSEGRLLMLAVSPSIDTNERVTDARGRTSPIGYLEGPGRYVCQAVDSRMTRTVSAG